VSSSFSSPYFCPYSPPLSSELGARFHGHFRTSTPIRSTYLILANGWSVAFYLHRSPLSSPFPTHYSKWFRIGGRGWRGVRPQLMLLKALPLACSYLLFPPLVGVFPVIVFHFRERQAVRVLQITDAKLRMEQVVSSPGRKNLFFSCLSNLFLHSLMERSYPLSSLVSTLPDAFPSSFVLQPRGTSIANCHCISVVLSLFGHPSFSFFFLRCESRFFFFPEMSDT